MVDAIGEEVMSNTPAVPTKPRVLQPTGASSLSRSDGATSNEFLITAALDRAGPASYDVRKAGVVQPKPQALKNRSAGSSSIIVSPRQKGNPVLNCIKSMPWEYGDIPADYVLGVTTCALFLSLKYHRLHPEYIYNRIRNLQGKYNLRLVLCMVDIPNHEESLKELSKTSLINNITVMLCWSAAEGGRYLELFKTYENAAPTAIKQYQSSAYSDRMVDFITTPRSINKTDAVALVSQFGSIRTAVNARHEDIATITGWGEKKVQRWCTAVREPFRTQRASKRSIAPKSPHVPCKVALADGKDTKSISRPEQEPLDDADDEAALAEIASGNRSKKRKQDDCLDDGVFAALHKLRNTS
ncbi:Hypothetical protein R9X50_00245500 [Acrodontium crateriforme]|uniref:ERCC1-like central domain-containing protein n=1 Tax=Acrodontium crateriforme TaxID=150365 RepID=A0AAQ3RB04_9PEZI|nr:Hypothetical protein R9X50_00245500 [Acrodontium crateriforme]